jgi:hypothetical protein
MKQELPMNPFILPKVTYFHLIWIRFSVTLKEQLCLSVYVGNNCI